MELCKGGSLVQLLKGPIALQRGLPEHRVCAIFKQICLGLQVLHAHQPPLAHRDLKLENVLMTEEGLVKLCDFGSASTRCKVYSKVEMGSEEEAIQKFSTPMYRAPEMVDLYQKWEIGYKADIWALGCILYVLAYLSHPFPDGGSLSIIGGVVPEPVVLPPPSPQLSPTPLTLVKKLLVVKPHRRPNIQKVIELVCDWENMLANGKIEKKTLQTTKKAVSPVLRIASSDAATAEFGDWDPFNQAHSEAPSSLQDTVSPSTESVSVHIPPTFSISPTSDVPNSNCPPVSSRSPTPSSSTFASFDDE
jgi:serine/threonine protein kinase